MKLIQLLETGSWENVKVSLLKYYPEQQKQTDKYRQVYEKLLSLEVVESDLTIEIHMKTYDDDDVLYPELYGRNFTLHENPDESERFGLDATPWKEWLDMVISVTTLSQFTKDEIIAICLYEMTFYGFDEETIQKFWDDIEKQGNEYENMSPEEREKNTYSFDQIKEEFDLED